MLTRSGPLPEGRGWAFEPKLDGFRALVCTHRGLRVRSRRGWNMTALLPELQALPSELQLDGELVAYDADGKPDFYRLCRRMLHRDASIPVVLVVFDVLAIEGEATLRRPYAERRERLEALGLHRRCWQTAPAFDDGEALYRVVCERGWRVSSRSGCATRAGRESAAG